MFRQAIIFVLLSFANFTAISARDDPFGIPDTLTIGSIEAEPNSSLSIPVFLFNDEQLMGMTIPLKLTGNITDITCDSIIFNPNRTENLDFVNALIDNDNKSFLLGIIPSLDSSQIHFEPDTGLLCEIFITIGDVWDSEIETLTTAQLPPFNTLKFVGDSITPFEPEFIPGIIQINPTGISDQIISPNRSTINLATYPNPFNSTVNVEVWLPEDCMFKLQIYNILGQIIYRKIYHGISGVNKIMPLDFQGQPSGVYFIGIQFGHEKTVDKVLFLK